MIGALVIIAAILGFIAMDLRVAIKILYSIDRKLASPTKEGP